MYLVIVLALAFSAIAAFLRICDWTKDRIYHRYGYWAAEDVGDYFGALCFIALPVTAVLLSVYLC